VDRKKTIFALLYVVLACPAIAQELFVNGGATLNQRVTFRGLFYLPPQRV